MINNKKIICNKTFDKNEMKKLIEWFLINYGTIRTSQLLDKLKNIGFKYTTLAGISIGIEDLNVPITRKNLFQNTEKDLEKSKNLFKQGEITLSENADKIIKSWNVINEILKKELIKNFREKDLLNPVYIMTFSGARGNISQIRQLIGMRGLMSDSKGEIINLPIKSNLKEGLKVTEYFISCYGARKGLVDTALKTANSGYLTRRLIYVTQNQIIEQSNCGSKKAIIVKIRKDKKFFNSTKEKIIGKVVSKNIMNKEKANAEIIACQGQDICNYLAKKILICKNVSTIKVRSPLTCELNRGICQLCYGWNLGNGRMVELGETVGILAAQSIGEPGTQLTMRTFHTGGVFSGEVEETITAPVNGIISYDMKNGGKIIKTKYGEKAFLTLKEKTIKIIKNKKNALTIRIPENSTIFTRTKKKVYFKQIIAETGAYKKIKSIKMIGSIETQEVTTKISGETYFDKITRKNQDVESKKKGIIWILSGNILTNNLIIKNLKKKKNDKKNSHYKHEDNFFKIYKDEKRIKKDSRNKRMLKLSANKINVIINFRYTSNINKKEKLYRITKKTKVEKRILINKNKTEKHFKLKTTKLKLGQFLLIGKDIEKKKNNKYNCQIIQKTKHTTLVRKANSYLIYDNYKVNIKNNDLIKKNSVIFQSLHKKRKTEDIVQGLPRIEELLEAKKNINSETINNTPNILLFKIFDKLSKKNENKEATRKSIKKIQVILIREIQKIYENQGVKIANKHIEMIVKQMTSKVMIIRSGESNLIAGETIEINKIEKINSIIKNKAIYEPIILGISKLSLSNQSFISEASFQETTRVLARSAIEGRTDWLFSLPSNIVMGNLIPAGTGFKFTCK